jgi:TPP-dependent indolepyruvate ferredoxin oxidoreductase alpha subunit
LSQHAAASKKKKWLLLSQWLQSQHSTSSNTFAGRLFWPAPQNPTGSARDLTPPKICRDVPHRPVFFAMRGAVPC